MNYYEKGHAVRYVSRPAVTPAGLFWLFLIGSLAGVVMEGAWCAVTKGRWEYHVYSIWGPFCAVYGLGAQLSGKVDALGIYAETGDIYGTVIEIIKTIPLYPVVLVLIILSMVAFYASSFDSITLVACQYSYIETTGMEASPKKMRLFWAVFLILLPIALIFSEGSMNNLQTVSIIAAFPIGLVILLIIFSFIKDAKKYVSGELNKH